MDENCPRTYRRAAQGDHVRLSDRRFGHWLYVVSAAALAAGRVETGAGWNLGVLERSQLLR